MTEPKKPPLSETHPDLAAQWDPTKNGDLTPDDVVAGSAKKYWWVCDQGPDHVWEASPNKRSSGRGCPFCSGHKVSVTNSLASLFPEIAADWHPTKNEDLTPEKITAGNNRKVWWICENGPDHEWQATVGSRTKQRVGCPFCAGQRASITNSLGSLYPSLTEEWLTEKNAGLSPFDVVAGSNKKFWWKCPEGPDHEWEASSYSRAILGTGCPFCLGQRVSTTNSLANLFPEIASQWHPTKNKKLKPTDIPSGHSKNVWWRCPLSPDHEWQASPSRRTNRGDGCPYCRGLKLSVTNSLLAKYPELASQWHPTKNGDLTPDQVIGGSHKKHWWICERGPDHEWEGSVISRLQAPGCPFCINIKVSVTNSLASLFPEIADEWHPTRNKPLKPEDILSGSGKKYWWKCREGPDHEWEATVVSRTSIGNGCPYCANKRVSVTNNLAVLYPEIAKEWHPVKNNSVTPEDIVAGTHQKAWWRCESNEEHVWEANVVSRTHNKNGCPYCSQGWTIDNIRLFVQSLQDHLTEFTPAELYLLFQQNGLLGSAGKGRAFANALTTGRIPFEEIEKFIAGEPSVADAFIEDKSASIEEALEALAGEEDVGAVVDESALSEEGLPIVQTQDALKALDAVAVTTDDEEAIDFLLASARAKLWRHAWADGNEAVRQAQSYQGSEYADQVRAHFLHEYGEAQALEIPPGYAFRVDGQPAEPNLMQRLAAVSVRDQRRIGNWSGTGAGKTLSAVLASRVIGARLTVITCPNSVVDGWVAAIRSIYPDSDVQDKTFEPDWQPGSAHRYLVLNYERFQQHASTRWIRDFLEREQIDFIVVDEIHYTKQRSENKLSLRKKRVGAMIQLAAEANPDLAVIGMSATPVINNLYEGKSLVEMITGLSYDDLETRATVSNCMALHQKLVTLGMRWMPAYDIQFEQEIVPVDCTAYLPDLHGLKAGTDILGLEQLLTEVKLPEIVRILKANPRPTLLYTHYIDGIDRILQEGLVAAGFRVGFYTGEDKSGLNAFLRGKVDVLIGTAAIGTGVDGLQHVCDQLIVNVLPWTAAGFEQLKGRIYRQGQRSEKVKVFIPVTEAEIGGETWSWCRSKLARISFKKSIADAAVDGIVPEGHLRTPAQAYRDIMGWLRRLEAGEMDVIRRPQVAISLPPVPEEEAEKRLRKYGDFSRMNNRWNSSKSSTTHERLQEDPTEWEQYHRLYREARETWKIVPYEEMIRWCEEREGYTIGDFGCGEAKLAEAVGDLHTVYSFDHVAINESVTACDMAQVPLEDGVLDVAIFSLSLMGSNFMDYLKEAHRTLRLDGQLHVIETASGMEDVEAFTRDLETLGFEILNVEEMWKFIHIRAIKTRANSKLLG